jgi:hypothetical protein
MNHEKIPSLYKKINNEKILELYVLSTRQRTKVSDTPSHRCQQTEYLKPWYGLGYVTQARAPGVAALTFTSTILNSRTVC